MNHAIRNMTHHALLGHGDIPDQPGYCLKFVRRIIEQAFDWPDGEFYQRYGVARTTQGSEDRADWSWWAADIEAATKQLGLAVPFEERQPGDLIFNHMAAKPIGHVALLYDTHTVAENIKRDYRPHSLHFPRCLALTPLHIFPGVTLVARIPQA